MPAASSPTPILLVADSPETCERIASALLSAPTFYRIERVTSEDLVKSGPPSDIFLALVEQALLNAKQPQVVQQLSSAGMAVVAMVSSQDVQALQEVVLAGAAALLATPFVDTQLWETVATAMAKGAQPAAKPENARSGWRPAGFSTEGLVVAIHGPKGGSGTSVLATNLAVTLQERAPRGVVLVELGDGPGNLAVLLNLRAERTMSDLLARFDPGDTELLTGVLTAHSSGIRVLLAPPMAGLKMGGDFLEDIISALQAQCDFVVIDVLSSARTSAVSIMRKAHAAMVVVVPEMTALHHGRLFVEQAEAAIPDVKLNVILNRANMAGGVPADAIRRHLKMQTAVEIPDDPALVTGSVNRGVPLVTSHPRSPLTKAIQKLARDLSPADPEQPQERSSFPSAIGSLARFSFGGRR